MVYKLSLLFSLSLFLLGYSSQSNNSLIVPDIVAGLVHETLNFSVQLVSSESEAVCWEPSTHYITPLNKSTLCFQITRQENETVFIKSSLIGIFDIKFYQLNQQNGTKEFFEDGIEIVVGRNKVVNIFITNIFLAIGLGIALFIMGMEINTDIVLQVIKRPIGPAVGFCAQFLIMPGLAYLLGYLLLNSNIERLGLLLLGCCPGGVGSNFWTAFLKGDINLSVTMTFFSSLASFAMTSLWIYFLGRPLASRHVPIPFTQLVISLVTFMVPLLLGVWVRRSKPEVADKITKKGKPYWIAYLAVILILAIYMNLHFFFLVTWRHLVAGTCLGILGYTLGGGAALVFKMGKPQVIAIAIETAIQNAGIALVVINLTFPSPYSDMAIMPVLSQVFCSAGPLLFIIFLLMELYKKLVEKMKNNQNGNNTSILFSPIDKDDPEVDIQVELNTQNT